jgi:hypothetical protein
MSWKRGQAGGFPGLLPARWELFLPRRKARGVILGKRSSSAPDSSGIRIVPYMGRSPRPGSRGLSHMWDNPPCRRAEELCSESAPPLRRTGRESGLSHIWDDPPGRGAADCPICGTIPLAEGPRSYARKASPLYAGQFGNPDCPVYGTIPPGRGAADCPICGTICGTIPLAEGPECSIWGDNLHRREIGAFRSPDAVLQHIAIYFTPKGETHDGLLPASSTHGSWTGPCPFRRQRDLHRRHFPGNSR